MVKTVDYKSLRTELDDILVKLEDDSMDVEAVTSLYQRGMEIAAELEKYLKTAENKVQKIKAHWDTPAV